jgi:hypothetical protein
MSSLSSDLSCRRDAEVVYNTGDIDDTRSVEVSVEVPGSTNNLAWSSPVNVFVGPMKDYIADVHAAE